MQSADQFPEVDVKNPDADLIENRILEKLEPHQRQASFLIDSLGDAMEDRHAGSRKEDYNLERLALLPDKIDLKHMDEHMWSLLMKLIRDGFGEALVSKLPEKFEMSEICHDASEILNILAEEGYAENLIKKLPDRFNFISQSDGASYFLTSLVRAGYASELVEKLPDQIDFKTMEYRLGIFLVELVKAELFKNGFIEKLLAKLPTSLDLVSITDGASYFLETLATKGFAQILIAKLPDRIDLEAIDDSASGFLTALIARGYAGDIITKLPNVLALFHLNLGISKVLIQLVVAGYSNELIAKVPDEIILNDMSYAESNFLTHLVLNGCGQKIFAKLPDFIDLKSIDFEKLKYERDGLLSVLIKDGYGLELLEKLPTVIDLEAMSLGESYFLATLVREGFGQELLARISDKVDIYKLTHGANNLLHALSGFKYGREFINLLLENARSVLRSPIYSHQFELPTKKLGWDLLEIIAHFPINRMSVKYLRGGWMKADLIKSGSKTSVYIRTDGDLVKIVFRNEGIEDVSLNNYRRVQKIIPDFVSSAIYPELIEFGQEIERTKFYSQGYREVYAGPSLNDINIEKLPEAIGNNILLQKEFIILTLFFHNIDHGHTHNGNFNVRFLLEGDGQKMIVFDVNKAMKMAKERQWILTPIVILRDWDRADSSPSQD